MLMTLPFLVYLFRTQGHWFVRLAVLGGSAIIGYNLMLTNIRAVILFVPLVLMLCAIRKLLIITPGRVPASAILHGQPPQQPQRRRLSVPRLPSCPCPATRASNRCARARWGGRVTGSRGDAGGGKGRLNFLYFWGISWKGGALCARWKPSPETPTQDREKRMAECTGIPEGTRRETARQCAYMRDAFW